MLPLLCRMKSKLLLMMMVLVVDGGGDDGNDVDVVDNGDECDGDKSLNTNLEWITFLQSQKLDSGLW